MLQCTDSPRGWGGESRVTARGGNGSGLWEWSSELSQVAVVAMEELVNGTEVNPVIGDSEVLDLDLRSEIVEVEDGTSVLHQMNVSNVSCN